jgi:uncharacterized damage-inducible protein DinB
MISLEQLGKEFMRNVRVIEMQTKGLSHADSLLQPEARGNCMNWVLGHIAASRDSVLKMLDQEPLLTKAENKRYNNGSEPILENGEDVIRLERLLELIQAGQERIEKALAGLEMSKLEEMVGKDGDVRLGDRLHFWYFHDTYHTGQTEYLRQLAGMDDQVI